MTKKLYLVVERSFSYNDEYYHAEEGGFPKHAYSDRDTAEKVRVEMDAKSADDWDSWLSLLDVGGEDVEYSKIDDILSVPWERFAGFLRVQGVALPFDIGRPDIFADHRRVFRGVPGSRRAVWGVMNDWWGGLTKAERVACAPHISVSVHEVQEINLD